MKHTIAKYFAAAAALCLTVVGCSTLQEDKGVSESRDIKFSASIGSFQVKATDTAFENGDAMGLYAENQVKAENVRLTWKDGALTPDTPVQWGWNQLVDESTLFYAYYPYTAEPVFREGDGNNYLEFTVQTDQSTHAAYTASDLMTASTYATPAEGTVNFAFVHRMAKLVLTIDNRLQDPVKEVYVGNVQTTGHYDIARSQDYYSLGERGSIKAGEGVTAEGAKAWSVILPSQDCQITLMLVTESGKEYVYKSENYVYFGAARRHSAQVILDETAISASFSATVYDWIDSGDFWFTQPNPIFDGNWTMIGTFGGSYWDRDLMLYQAGNVWYTDVTLHAGDEFKFRKDGSWDVNFGGAQGASSVSGNEGYIDIYQGGSNFIVEESGFYIISLDLEKGNMYFLKRSTTPAVEGTSVWEGVVLLTNWETLGLGTADMWETKGLKVGDEIRIYYEGYNFDYKEYWRFQVSDGHNSVFQHFDNYYSFFPFGYVSINVTEMWYNALTNVEGAEAGIFITGDNAVITAITIAEPSTPPTTGWMLIGSIMGYNWDHDIAMENWGEWGQPNKWAINISSKTSDAFKFRKDADWAENLGINGGWTISQNPYVPEHFDYTCSLVQDGDNIQLPFDGNWDLILNTDDNTLTATFIQPDNSAISSISEAVYAPDDSKVIIQAQVYALSSRGFVIFDGKYGLFVYTGSTAPTCQIGDIVIVQGYKTTYNNVPEITNTDLVVYTVKSGVDMQFQPSYSDITGTFNEPLFDFAAPIVYEGVLQLNGTNYIITVNGATMTGEAFWPDASLNLDALNGHYVRVSGFYNGYKQSIQYIIVNGVEDKGEAEIPTYEAKGDGSLTNPYNATAAFQVVSALESGATLEGVYIKGIISQLIEQYGAKYGNATFYISDDGSTTAPQFYAYRVMAFDGAKWVETNDYNVNLGDEVVIYGEVTNYKGTTPETSASKACLYMLNGYRPE